MFKRLSRATAVRDDVDGADDVLGGPVSLETVLDENSASEDDSDDSESGGAESGSDDDDDDAAAHAPDEDGALTVAMALQSPIYVDDDQSSKVVIYRCVVCPTMTLKTEKSIDVHLASKVWPMRSPCTHHSGISGGKRVLWHLSRQRRRKRAIGCSMSTRAPSWT